jgi:multidrug resistance protein, MATE family
MDFVTAPASIAGTLPAQRIDAAGRAHVDQRAVLALALPLMVNSAVQIVLNLTDMWFIGHISTQALAAVGAVQWLVLAVVLGLGGVGSAVQTIVAQAQGARRYRRASQAVWTAMWATLCTVPAFVAIGEAGHLILAPFGFDPAIERLAVAFWLPRVSGAVFGSAVWAVLAFFNGVSRPRITVFVTAVTAIVNVVFNELFIFRLGMGIAGPAACSSSCAWGCPWAFCPRRTCWVSRSFR